MNKPATHSSLNPPHRPLMPPAERQQFTLLRPSEVASLLGLSVITIRRRIQDGSLPHTRLNKRLYVRLSAVKAYVERHSTVLWTPPANDQE